MMAMPICESIVCARLLVKIMGATSSTRAKPPHTAQRPMLIGRNSWKSLRAMSALPRAEQAARPEHQDQHQEHVRQDGRDLRDLQLPQRVAEGLRRDVDPRR